MKEGELKIQYLNVQDLIPYKKNPRKNDSAVEAVAESIKIAWFINPIIIDSNNEIVAGHTRLKAAKKLGIKKVPTISSEGLTEEQIKAYRIADNKTSEFALWNNDLLSIELSEITDIDMSVFGFDLDEEEELKKEKKNLSPYKFCHVLISLPVDKIEQVAEIIKYCESKGYEYEQSNN
jgi:ParB-like chromosome segregation protein Spo0J